MPFSEWDVTMCTHEACVVSVFLCPYKGLDGYARVHWHAFHTFRTWLPLCNTKIDFLSPPFPPPHCSHCMASGGGGHPSHLPIIPPITSHHQTFTSSGGGSNSIGTGGRVRGSLQTPDASSLFVSSLGGAGMGGSGNSTNANFAPSPMDHSQSFNSLEELLNVTGINSLELDLPNGAKRPREQDGVDSLQRIAKEVESGGGMLEPPNKRMHLDTPLNVTLNATTTSSSLSSGSGSYASIHSSSTTTLPSLPAFSSSLPQSTFTNSIHSTTPIASLLDKKDFPGSSSSSIQEPKASNPHMFPQSSSVSLPSISSHLPSLPPHPPPPYSFNNTSSPPRNVSPAIGGASVSNGNTTTPFSSTSLVDLTVGNNSSTVKQSANLSQPASLSQPLNLSQQANLPQPSRLQQQPATGAPQQPAAGSQASGNTSKLADSINSNSRSVVIQLMQLYKQYQSLNDQQGMKRVRDQLNMLVFAQQKILAAQNNMVKTTAERTATETTPSTAGSVASAQPVGGRMGGVSVSSAQQPQPPQQQQAQQILGQLAGIAKGGQSQTGSSGGNQLWQGSGGGGGNVQTSTSANNHVKNIGTAADWQGGSFAEKGGTLSSLPPPPAYSDASMTSSSVVNTPPSLLSHMGSGASAGSSSNTGKILNFTPGFPAAWISLTTTYLFP